MQGHALYPELEKITQHWIENSTEVKDYESLPQLRVEYRNLLEKQRRWLLKENNNNERIDEEVVRKYLVLIDLEESRIQGE